MSFLRPQQDFESPSLGEHFYRGIVVDNVDPQKLHRVKIRIEELHGTTQEIPDSNLPWAMHFRPSFLGGSTDLSSSSVPRVGSEVIVTHIRGEIYQPAYMFELSHAGNKLSQASEDYPDSYVFRDSDNNFWHVNMVQDKLDIKFNGTEFIEITLDRNTIIGNTIDNLGDDNRTVIRDVNDIIGRDETCTIENNSIRTVGNDQTEDIINNEVRTIGADFTETVGSTHTQNAATFNINTSGNTNITASGNVVVEGSLITLNGAGGGVLTQESINPLTGTPFPDGSTTVKAGDG